MCIRLRLLNFLDRYAKLSDQAPTLFFRPQCGDSIPAFVAACIRPSKAGQEHCATDFARDRNRGNLLFDFVLSVPAAFLRAAQNSVVVAFELFAALRAVHDWIEFPGRHELTSCSTVIAHPSAFVAAQLLVVAPTRHERFPALNAWSLFERLFVRLLLRAPSQQIVASIRAESLLVSSDSEFLFAVCALQNLADVRSHCALGQTTRRAHDVVRTLFLEFVPALVAGRFAKIFFSSCDHD